MENKMKRSSVADNFDSLEDLVSDVKEAQNQKTPNLSPRTATMYPPPQQPEAAAQSSAQQEEKGRSSTSSSSTTTPTNKWAPGYFFNKIKSKLGFDSSNSKIERDSSISSNHSVDSIILANGGNSSDLDTNCNYCKAEFTVWFRKHHCRQCGGLVIFFYCLLLLFIFIFIPTSYATNFIG